MDGTSQTPKADKQYYGNPDDGIRAKALTAVRELKALYPDAACSLLWCDCPDDPAARIRDGWKLAVMGCLSAQCTDARVNAVCADLFAVYPTVGSLGAANPEDVEPLIKPCGLYRTKAKNVVAACHIISETYGGLIPADKKALTAMPGIGGKIANLLLGDIYGIPGIVPDTHCMRICARIGLIPEAGKPEMTERVLSNLIPPDEMTDFCHRLVDFGRDICVARGPRCRECPLSRVCTAGRQALDFQ